MIPQSSPTNGTIIFSPSFWYRTTKKKPTNKNHPTYNIPIGAMTFHLPIIIRSSRRRHHDLGGRGALHGPRNEFRLMIQRYRNDLSIVEMYGILHTHAEMRHVVCIHYTEWWSTDQVSSRPNWLLLCSVTSRRDDGHGANALRGSECCPVRCYITH